jgi:hypothetical protein
VNLAWTGMRRGGMEVVQATTFFVFNKGLMGGGGTTSLYIYCFVHSNPLMPGGL